MDKFAVLQLKKKKKREEEAKAKGQTVGDVLHAEKQTLTRNDLEKMSKAFGYLDPPTACYAVGKDGNSAIWWVWKNPHSPYYPEPLSDDELEEENKDQDSDYEDNHHGVAPVVEEKVEEKVEEEEVDEFDEDGNLIIKGPTKAELEAKRLRKEAKAGAKLERENKRAAKLLDGTAKVKIKCEGCGKRFKIGTKACNKCFRGLKQPDLEEIARLEAEAKAEAEAKLADAARVQAEKDEARRLRREEQSEQMNKRIKGFQINRYRKDPHKGQSPSGKAKRASHLNSPLSLKAAPAFGARHASHNGEGGAAGVSLYSEEAPYIPHYSEDNVESDEMGIWRKKGSYFFAWNQESTGKMQVILDELPNNYEYRFTVSTVNGFGVGVESTPSNIVMIEKPLPAGWNRFFAEDTKRFYYANLKCNMALWARPDLNAYFLEESILLMFNNAEITYLRGLYDEEMAHFQYIIVDRFIDVLAEVGEKMSKYRVIRLFIGYAGDDYKFKEWRLFMDIFHHIKKRKKMGSVLGQVAAAADLGRMVKRQAVASILGDSENKMGDWIVEYSAIADREFYRNKRTKETSWDMPDEVRFFLPGKLEAKLMKVFDYGHIETFKQYYSMLDVDNSGDLSDQEIKRLLSALGINITDDGLAQLVATVDLNGNGTIEFDEFCWMMYEMSRTDGEGALSGLQGKIPMTPSKDAGDAPVEGDPQTNTTMGTSEAGAGSRPGTATDNGDTETSSRPATAGLLLDLESLSKQLAQDTGHGLVDQHGREVLSHSDPTGAAVDNIGTGIAEGAAAATATEESVPGTGRREQTETATVEVASDGKIVPRRPGTGAGSSMYVGATNAFDGPRDATTEAGAGAVGVVGTRRGDDEVKEDGDTLQRVELREKVKPGAASSSGSEDGSVVSARSRRGAGAGASDERSVGSKSIRSAQSMSPKRVAVAPSSARSSSSGGSDDLDRLISGKTKQGKVVKMDISSQKGIATKDYHFGDNDYDLDHANEYDEDGKLASAPNNVECPVCGIASDFYKCKKCYDIGYCSRACCMEDYPSHKLVCVVKTKEQIEESKRANVENEEREAREAKEAAEKARIEAEEVEYDAMLEQYEDEGGVLVGPEEEIDPITNEPRRKKYTFNQRMNMKVWTYFYPKTAAEEKERNTKIQKRIDFRRQKRKDEDDARRLRDANSIHGPYCFCGCRAY